MILTLLIIDLQNYFFADFALPIIREVSNVKKSLHF